MGRENASATFRVLDGNGDGRLTRKVRIYLMVVMVVMMIGVMIVISRFGDNFTCL